MQRLVNEILERARANRQCIILPEGTEKRTLKAANQILTDGITNLILLGNPVEINACATEWGLGNVSKATTIDPENSPKQEEYAQLLFELRKGKGMTIEKACKLVINLLYLGYLIIKNDDMDGQLADTRNTTGDALCPALQTIKTTPGIICIFGAMLLLIHTSGCEENGVLVTGGVAITSIPDASWLAQIVVCTARMVKAVTGLDPKMVLLSFSTKGFAKHEVVDKVVKALKIARELAPDIAIDDELRADAALIPEVGTSRAPDSAIAGNANVLVIPSLEVDNISYGLVRHLGHADVAGPILQGIARPVSDLSHGYSIEDVYRMIAITVNQAIAAEHGK